MEKEVTISKTFTIPQLIKFVSAPVLTRFFISLLCTLDDGLFISRYCGEYSLAAFSLLMPYFTGTSAFAVLLAGVGNVCSIKLGEKKKEEAQSIFSSMVILSFLVGVLIALLIALFINPFLEFLGATETLLPLAKSYLSVAITYIPFLFPAYIFERFYAVSGKPQFSAWINVLQTIFNFFFDWLFMVKMSMGLAGTAYSNLISNIVIFIVSLIFFFNKDKEFHFGKPLKNPLHSLYESCRFGRTDFLSTIALCVTSYVINQVLLNLGAEVFLAAYSIVNTIQNMLLTTFSALFSAISPIASYAYGEKNEHKLKRILHQSFTLMAGLIVLDAIVVVGLKEPLIDLYLVASDNLSIREMVSQGMRIIPFALPFFGVNALVETMAVAIDQHKISLTLSILENVLFANLAVLLIPHLFGIDSIWYCFLVREVATFLFCLFFLFKKQISFD